MDLIAFESLIKSENTAKYYLLKFCWKNHQRHCPRCKWRKFYRLADKRFRCADCGYTYHDFTGRFINEGALSPREWLRIIKLFEFDLPLRTIAAQMNLAYNTAYRAVSTIRNAILAQTLDAAEILRALEEDCAAFAQRHEEGMSPDNSPGSYVFGIIEREGLVFIDYIPELNVENIIHFKNSFYLKTAQIGQLVYTDKYRHYLSLVCRPEDSFKYVKHRDKGLLIDSKSPFWRYAKDKLKKFRGVSAEKFPLYIKELEFRYNNRDKDIFPILADYLCRLQPSSPRPNLEQVNKAHNLHSI